MKTFLSLVIVVLSLFGLLNASYITWNELSGQIPPCSPPFACDTVLNSSWSKIGPVPLAGLGMVFYGAFMLVSGASVLDYKQLKIAKFTVSLPALIFVMGCLGAAFSAYLILVMAVVLKAWCLYCLLSATDCAIVFGMSFGLWKSSDMPSLLKKESYALHV